MKRFGNFKKVMIGASLFIAALVIVTMIGGALVGATSTATISTDKTKYAVGETMVITGSGFTADGTVNIIVQEPGNAGTDILPPVSTDASGSFQTTYSPPMIPGRYKITATDGANSALTAATEADAVGYDKSGYDKGTSSWGTGQQSGYAENDWVQYQYTVTGITGTVPSFNVMFDEAVGGRIFIDALSNFRVAVDKPYVAANSVLPDGTPEPPATDGGDGFWAFTPLNINQGYNDKNHTFTGDDPLNSPSAVHAFRIDPATIHATNSNFPASFSSGTHTVTIYFEAKMAASFVWSTGHEYLLSNPASLYGAHAPAAAVPAGVVYGTHVYDDWTTTAWSGAGGGGANKHFTIDGQSAGPSGAIALPIPAVTLPTGSITVIKVTSPASAPGVAFNFTSDFGPFTLDTDAGTPTIPNTTTFSSLPAGTFSFT